MVNWTRFVNLGSRSCMNSRADSVVLSPSSHEHTSFVSEHMATHVQTVPTIRGALRLIVKSLLSLA